MGDALDSQRPKYIQTQRHSPNTTKNQNAFVLALFHCSLGAFMLGWHVHEKAIIAPALLLALIAPTDARCGACAHVYTYTNIKSIHPQTSLPTNQPINQPKTHQTK